MDTVNTTNIRIGHDMYTVHAKVAKRLSEAI